ncbi:hypothetical protein C5167_001790 [Papaver somniferum]|uniref:FBD domain-containing protein n=1 Tax=Papaver somniferum TaxID=3469 RepID=A0A4Y7KSW4_PAPSO|nr:hypothetical protein C5167_001790 [Papaver somniferum]
MNPGKAVVDLSNARYVRTGLEAFKQFFGALAHVKCLTVKNPPLQVNNLLMNSPVYHNIERLRITRGVNSDVAVIAFLKAYIDIVDHGSEDNGWTSLDLVDTGCLFRRLKSVCLSHVLGAQGRLAV